MPQPTLIYRVYLERVRGDADEHWSIVDSLDGVCFEVLEAEAAMEKLHRELSARPDPEFTSEGPVWWQGDVERGYYVEYVDDEARPLPSLSLAELRRLESSGDAAWVADSSWDCYVVIPEQFTYSPAPAQRSD